jgi:uncharacterized protein (TIGR03790 family)
MLRNARWVLVAVVAATGMLASPAAALSAREVLVVANEASKESVDLAKFYATQRAIPDENIVLVTTTTNYEVSRAAYDKEIVAPIRQAVAQRKLQGIRCICLMYGVPVRVAGPALDEDGKALLVACQQAAGKAQMRLAVDLKLASNVTRSFPKPAISGIKPVGRLFDVSVSEPSQTPPIDELTKNLQGLLSEKHRDVAKVAKADEQKIAYRQMMGLHMDAFGLQGLKQYVAMATPPDAPELATIDKQIEEAAKRLADVQKLPITATNLPITLDLAEALAGASGRYAAAVALATQLDPPNADASVDSELSLIAAGSYSLAGPVNNPLYWRNPESLTPPPLLLTARIDGPSAADAMAIIKASIEIERSGLTGKVYLDAGGQVPGMPAEAGKQYDEHFRRMATLLAANTKLKVVLDEKTSVFQPSTCPDTALYCGWYSLQKYVPAFTFNRGSVGWHVASWEAMHLRDPNSNEWCVKMLQNGVAATLGAVNEPYLGAFPAPEEFFALLLTGRYTLAECYWRTSPSTSWRFTLIGDPLYRPYAANPQVAIRDLPSALLPPESK